MPLPSQMVYNFWKINAVPLPCSWWLAAYLVLPIVIPLVEEGTVQKLWGHAGCLMLRITLSQFGEVSQVWLHPNAERWQNLPIQTQGRLFEEPVSAKGASGAWCEYSHTKIVISNTIRSVVLLMELQLQTITVLVTAHSHLSGTTMCVCSVPLGLTRGSLP